MRTEITQYIFNQAKKHEPFPDGFFPVTEGDMFIGIADGSNNYQNIGVKEGTLLFFDRSKRYKMGVPSMFVNPATGSMAMLRTPRKGFSYAGTLVATLSMQGE